MVDNQAFASLCNFCAAKARYPFLFFMNECISYSSDVLAWAINELSDPGTFAVGLQVDEAQVMDSMDQSTWDKSFDHGIDRISSLLCRKEDFEKLGTSPYITDQGLTIGELEKALRNRTRRTTVWMKSKYEKEGWWSSLKAIIPQDDKAFQESISITGDSSSPDVQRLTPNSPKRDRESSWMTGSKPMSAEFAWNTRRDLESLPEASIIICVHDAVDDVKRCLDSVMANTNLNRNHLIIVDDGSQHETKNLLAHYAIMTGAAYFRNDHAQGYTRAANQGIRAATDKIIVLLNSDTITTSGWLDRLIRCATSRPSIACVGPLSNAASWQSIPHLVDETGQWYVNRFPEGVTLEEYARRIATNSPRLYPAVTFINGFCLLITRAAIEKIGLLDETVFPQGYGEEDDFCLRALDAGFENAVADDCYIFHAKSKSFTPEGRATIVRESKHELFAKHGRGRVLGHIRRTRESEQLLIARTWARLVGDAQKKDNLRNDLKGRRSPLKIGWLQPHLDCVGGIRRAIEMTNRLVSWGHNVHLITPDGLKTWWMPIFAEVTTVEEARQMRFDVLLLSDPEMVEHYQTMNGLLHVNYHMAACMLYRDKNEALNQYYAHDQSVVHVANSAWTAQQVERHYPIQIKGIFPGGIDKRLFSPYNVTKKVDIVCYGSKRPHKGTGDIERASQNFSLLKLAQLQLEQRDLAPCICSGRIFVSACGMCQ
jgi:GT2 family glycosyltransferase